MQEEKNISKNLIIEQESNFSINMNQKEAIENLEEKLRLAFIKKKTRELDLYYKKIKR